MQTQLSIYADEDINFYQRGQNFCGFRWRILTIFVGKSDGEATPHIDMGRRSTNKKQTYRKSTGDRGRHVTVQEPDTLLSFLFQLLNEQSKSSVKSLLKHGQIYVNGRVSTQFDTPLQKGDQVKISYERGRVEFNHPLLRIVSEDEDLIVVDKREGLLASGNAQVKERTAFSLLADYLKRNDPRSRLFLLNPLDKETSGLMLFARNRGVQQYFLDNWNHVITLRRFVIVVEGVPEKESGVLTSSGSYEEGAKVFVTSASESRETILRYKVLRNNGSYSLIEVFQEAGKKNIIREQMERMGHPVVGVDEENGNPLGRVAIHANRLCLKHPVSGEVVCFDSHYPPAFNLITKKNSEK